MSVKVSNLNIMCTNTSICLVVKMKFISQTVLECGRILWSCVRLKTASGQKYASGFDVTSLLWSQLEPRLRIERHMASVTTPAAVTSRYMTIC